MSITSLKTRQSSERFLLVRVNPARFILPSLYSGQLYKITFPFTPNKITRNDIILEETNGVPTSNDQWWFDEGNNTLWVRLASAPNETTNILVAYHYIFLTGTKHRSLPEDPEDPDSPIRYWAPLINNYPSFMQSFTNVVSGIFSINDTTLSLLNTNGNFQNYLDENDSFYNKLVDIWLCIDKVDNIQKVFTGVIQNVNCSSQNISLFCTDIFNILLQTAQMGARTSEAYYLTSSSYPNVDPSRFGAPCPYVFGKYSKYKANSRYLSTGYPTYLIKEGTEAVCISYSSTISDSSNRVWACCRQAGDLIVQNNGDTFGRAEGFLNDDPYPPYVMQGSLNDPGNIKAGDTLKWEEVPSGTLRYGLVLLADTFLVDYPANILVALRNSAESSGVSASAIVHQLPSFLVIIELAEGEYVYPLTERDYTVSLTPTADGSQKIVKITFVNDFEANLGMIEPLDPNKHKVYFRTSNEVDPLDDKTSHKHGRVVKKILESAGLSVDEESIDIADLDLPVDCRFQIPLEDESDFGSYLNYAQEVLKSTLGYLKASDSGEIIYELLKAPVSTKKRSSRLILQGSMSSSIDYSDIITEFIASNNQHNSEDVVKPIFPSADPKPSVSASNAKSQYLHGITKVSRFYHVLDEFETVLDRHIDLKSQRRVIYKFSTATEDLDTQLGEDLLLDNNQVLGSENTGSVKVTAIQKSADSTSIEASDLKGL